MQTLTMHGANRVLQRGITIEAVRKISDQEEILKRAKQMIAPIANGKALKFRYGGQQFTATAKSITMNLRIDDAEFIIGINRQHQKPIIVTAWPA